MYRPKSITKIYPIINLLILVLYYKCWYLLHKFCSNLKTIDSSRSENCIIFGRREYIIYQRAQICPRKYFFRVRLCLTRVIWGTPTLRWFIPFFHLDEVKIRNRVKQETFSPKFCNHQIWNKRQQKHNKQIN